MRFRRSHFIVTIGPICSAAGWGGLIKVIGTTARAWPGSY
jgi:hypothetical protein